MIPLCVVATGRFDAIQNLAGFLPATALAWLYSQFHFDFAKFPCVTGCHVS